jgi:pyruvate dehydrogenase E1 component beta subunit
MSREISYGEAIREATDQLMAESDRVYVMGLGSTDPKAIFGTTNGLEAKYGSKRVFDMPTSENAMTGVCIGSALMGMRPIMVHQRIDFLLLALDQIVNNAAKWYSMFNGQKSVPLVIRAIVGRGWGQGPQHSQNLQAMFAHVPGLKVVTPALPADAKGMLIAAAHDDDPVLFIEHRWLHSTFGPVAHEMYETPLGTSNIVRHGRDVSIVATSFMVIEALRAAEALARDGIEAEVIDVRSIRPLDVDGIMASVRKTGRLVACDAAWKTLGFAGELVALAAELALEDLRARPIRVTLPDWHTAASPVAAAMYYPTAVTIANEVAAMLGKPQRDAEAWQLVRNAPADQPDLSFLGPF